MKKSTIKKLILSLAICLVALPFTSCKKDELCDHPKLPCQTHEGRNTFGCLVDGQPFVAKTSFSIGGAVAVSGSFDESTRLLILEGDREDEQGHIDVVRFLVYVTNAVGVYVIHVINSYDGYIDYSGENCSYSHTSYNKGSVSIAYLDESKNIISGIFEMTLVNPDCPDSTMEITFGRFDFAY